MDRRKELENALNTLTKATDKEKSLLFKNEIEKIAGILEKLEHKEDKPFDPKQNYAEEGFDIIARIVAKVSGIWMHDVIDGYAKYAYKNSGRSTKYSTEKRLENCILIKLLNNRGSNKSQSMSFLAKISGEEKVSPEGFIKELRKTYKSYENQSYFARNCENDIANNTYQISKILNYSLIDFKDADFESCPKAYEAYFKLLEELMKLMRDALPQVKKDSCYIKEYGFIIDWIESTVSDPIEFFYNQEIDKSLKVREKRRYFSNYLDTCFIFKNKTIL